MKRSGKANILGHFKQNLNKWISNQELRQVAGYEGNDVPRVVRSLRQEGWEIEVRGDGYSRLTSLEKGPGRGKRETISEKLRYQVLARDRHRCRSCGRGVEDNVKLQVDHVIPVDWGGTNIIDNLLTLCDECNRGKKNWVNEAPKDIMQVVMSRPTVEARIEALFDSFPGDDIPSTMIQLVSKGALDWQRALRRIRERTGKKILPVTGRAAYRYFKEG